MQWWMAWGTFFLTGLVGSWHCAGMCGPFIAMAAARRPGWGGIVGYHAGKMAIYAILGVLAGGVGAWVQGFNAGGVLLLGISAGLLTVLMGLSLLGLPLPVPTVWVETVGAWMRRIGPVGLGFCAGALPCGLLYGAIAQATLWGPWRGAFLMVGFGLGTVPALTVVGRGVGWLGGAWRGRLRSLAAVALILLGTGVVLVRLAPYVPGLRALPFCAVRVYYGRPNPIGRAKIHTESIRNLVPQSERIGRWEQHDTESPWRSCSAWASLAATTPANSPVSSLQSPRRT